MKLRDAVTQHRLFTKTRLYSLYSDFHKLREANPDGYEANLIAWKALVDEFFTRSLLQHTFVLDTAGLQEELTLAEYGKPLALDLVLEALVSQGDLIPHKQYRESTDSIYAKRWVRPAVSWAVNRFIWDTSYRIGDRKNGLRADKLVSKKTLEKYETELSKRVAAEGQNGHSKLVFTKEELREAIDAFGITLDGASTHLSDLDYDILLQFLDRDVHKIKMRDNVVKFGQDEVTDEDVGISQIKSTVSQLELKVTELHAKIDSTDAKLKTSLSNKSNKQLSLNLLRSKKVAEQSLNKQLQSLNQLESVLYKIDESSTNLQLMSALEKGSSLLASLNAQLGGIERVEKVMDDVEEQKYTAEKIAEEITGLGTAVDEDEIEAEFEQMLNEETAKKEKPTDASTDDIAAKLGELKLAPSEHPSEIANTETKEAITN